MPTSGCGLVYFAVRFDTANPRPNTLFRLLVAPKLRFYRMKSISNQQKQPIFALYEVFCPLPVVCYSGKVKRLAVPTHDAKTKQFAASAFGKSTILKSRHFTPNTKWRRFVLHRTLPECILSPQNAKLFLDAVLKNLFSVPMCNCHWLSHSASGNRTITGSMIAPTARALQPRLKDEVAQAGLSPACAPPKIKPASPSWWVSLEVHAVKPI